MSVSDIILIILILCGAFYLVYYSVFRKKSQCNNCSVQHCERREEIKKVPIDSGL
jgi:hypothetical protein